MRFSAIALAAAIPALVSAATQTIMVGGNGTLTYAPASMNASLGDTINFVFQTKNHSVFQSSFTDPCTSNSSGFQSSFFPVVANASQLQSFNINVTQTAPIWFYCAQTTPVNHCQAGMVGVINPTADKTLDAFMAKAKGNSSSSNNTSSSSTSTASGAGSSSTDKPNGAMRISGGAAGLLMLVGLAAGVTL